MILFNTDAIALCLLRAEIRYKSGGHFVDSTVIREMYQNTIPLLKEHFTLFKTMRFIDISNTAISEVTQNNLPLWIKDNDLYHYL